LDEEVQISAAESSFDKWRRSIGLFLGPLIFFLILILSFDTLSPQAHRLLAVVSLVVIFWVTEAIPIPVTALLGAVLCVILGIGEQKEVLAHFANPIIFLFIGSFILAQSMRIHGLDRRFAFFILSRKISSRSYFAILAAVASASAFLAMWISNTAATAMLFPIALGILASLSESKAESLGGFRTALMLAVAYSCSIGGIATPVGTPPNLIGLGLIETILGKRIPFLGWMLLGVPLTVAGLFALLLIFKFLFKIQTGRLEGLSEQIQGKRKELGSWSKGERNTLIAFLTAVGLWISPGLIALFMGTASPAYDFFSSRIPEAVAALIAASLLFVLPLNWKKREFTITWKQAVRIDWGTILLFGGGLALGNLMFATGLAERLGYWILSLTGASSLWTLTLIAIATAVFLSDTTSNTASANMIIPVMIAVSQSAGVSPLPPALGATLGASFGFLLPVSTPPNAIVYASGLIPITKMIKTGFILDLTGILVIWLGLRILCPLLGLV
jgi:sodium-dependent dicarboxylate transporter 2/3/5